MTSFWDPEMSPWNLPWRWCWSESAAATYVSNDRRRRLLMDRRRLGLISGCLSSPFVLAKNLFVHYSLAGFRQESDLVLVLQSTSCWRIWWRRVAKMARVRFADSKPIGWGVSLVVVSAGQLAWVILKRATRKIANYQCCSETPPPLLNRPVHLYHWKVVLLLVVSTKVTLVRHCLIDSRQGVRTAIHTWALGGTIFCF